MDAMSRASHTNVEVAETQFFFFLYCFPFYCAVWVVTGDIWKNLSGNNCLSAGISHNFNHFYALRHPTIVIVFFGLLSLPCRFYENIACFCFVLALPGIMPLYGIFSSAILVPKHEFSLHT